MKLGPVMIDVTGTELGPDDAERLSHPQVGGAILFARNFTSPLQLVRLVAAIRALRKPQLLIAVDHEGGRVQRFHEGFTRIPPMREIGRRWDQSRTEAADSARACGFVIAAELQAHGVDFSFAPVLDIDHGESGVIGDRAFHSDPKVVAELAEAFVGGLARGGMTSVGKHYPGHGYVKADSHHEIPIDDRSLAEITAADLLPFRRLAKAGMGAVMPAHVIYPKVDARPAGFSPVWLQRILRGQLGFDGVIFSDDLSMEGASAAGGVVDRAHAALEAGCDVVLLCNDPRAQEKLLDGLGARTVSNLLTARLERLRGRAVSAQALAANTAYLEAQEKVAHLRTA
ncbi:MAG TPA: beta-N-acetylhexosaminidase [Usitatibacter sp.]|nr:beta-N-acetylhexosaminidase [Usitatibacter sp.]